MSRCAPHVFVLHGRIETVLHDAAVIPTDDRFSIRPYWEALVGAAPTKPATWSEKHWGRITERVWALSVGSSTPDDYDQIIARLRETLAEVAGLVRGEQPRGGRMLPLVAMPFLAIGGGGHGMVRGTVITQLLGSVGEFANEFGFDIALVTPDSSVFAAAQATRRELLAAPDTRAAQLGQLVRDGSLALFTGAGVGIPAGLPTWHQLVSELANQTGLDPNSLADLPAVDQAELIERLDSEGFQKRVSQIVGAVDTPSILHVLLSGLGAREVVTTNYDTLYELAVTQTGRGIETILPWSSTQAGASWILKLHGDVLHEKQIVLTRRHMVRYDSANRPSGSILQSLLLTRHLLLVGLSLTDDNVIRLAHEVQAYKELHGQSGEPFGTLLDVSGDDVRAQLWQGQIDWISLGEGDVESGARALELFLDELAIHASDDSSWLLDQRFEGMLDSDEQRALAAEARALYQRLAESGGGRLEDLRAALEGFGAS